MLSFLFKAPGLFRTAAATLLAVAEVADQIAPVLSTDLKSAAGVAAVVGIVRAISRKLVKVDGGESR